MKHPVHPLHILSSYEMLNLTSYNANKLYIVTLMKWPNCPGYTGVLSQCKVGPFCWLMGCGTALQDG